MPDTSLHQPSSRACVSEDVSELPQQTQKAYRSYRTRRKLADSAVVVEELWWQALDFARLNHNTISFFDEPRRKTAALHWNRISQNVLKVGEGLSRDDKALMLAFEHWIEAIDSRHRSGHNLRFYYNVWCQSQAGQPFFYWLDVGGGKDVDLPECPRTLLKKQCIRYLGPRSGIQIPMSSAAHFVTASWWSASPSPSVWATPPCASVAPAWVPPSPSPWRAPPGAAVLQPPALQPVASSAAPSLATAPVIPAPTSTAAAPLTLESLSVELWAVQALLTRAVPHLQQPPPTPPPLPPPTMGPGPFDVPLPDGGVPAPLPLPSPAPPLQLEDELPVQGMFPASGGLLLVVSEGAQPCATAFRYRPPRGRLRGGVIVGIIVRLQLEDELHVQRERELYEYIIKEGKIIHKQSGEPLDTSQGTEAAYWIFVMSTARRLYAGKKEKGVFQHSSFLAGGATIAAGKFIVRNGVIKSIWAYSGHYKPSAENLSNFMKVLVENGVDVKELEMHPFTKEYGDDPMPNDSKSVVVDTNTPQVKPTFQRTISGGLHSPRAIDIPRKAILERIKSKSESESYQLGHKVSLQWSTGAGPRIGCVKDYPAELRNEALEMVDLSSTGAPKPSASLPQKAGR
ncbi:hypothetical protein U9M48_005208 [Paspalum notatum var. saurae]|uniref:IQ domain-containing protein IQM3 n=1 Tax=Paspalum notatum var. saurae TaxID=547442 RepID=A0AAQ3SLB1_PASNO